MEPLMGIKEARRLGLIEAAIRGEISNREGAQALGISHRQFKRLRSRLRRHGHEPWSTATAAGRPLGPCDCGRLVRPWSALVTPFHLDWDSDYSDSAVSSNSLSTGPS